MTEDEIYRTSTQYRLWSFTEESLSALRSTTNALAATRVKDAIHRLRTENDGSSEKQEEGYRLKKGLDDVDCLTVEEEQKLVGYYCLQAMDLSDFCDFPTNVKASAVQFIKRFYLSNSPMTYHPKQIMPCALFLATKTENNYVSLKTFVSKLPKTVGSAEDVIAPEFLLTQGLRFTFDVRHPHRGLEGGFMELIALATGTYQDSSDQSTSGNKLQQAILQLQSPMAGKPRAKSIEDLKIRIQNAHGRAKNTLKTSAILTDAYFMYTPSQIWLSALLLVDEPLAHFYIDLKLSKSRSLESKLLSTLQACKTTLSSSVSTKPSEIEKKELKLIDKKLYKCRNPEKMDLVGINKAQKRDGEIKGKEGLDERTIKKRKTERENGQKDAELIFGPDLIAQKPSR